MGVPIAHPRPARRLCRAQWAPAAPGGVKAYSPMDRAPGPERLAVTTGLDSKRHLFAHALREKQVRLTRHYAPTCRW
ncbi:hypothetical protein [Hymenobacter fodinae]|uniref:Uncharacterized protein n=1 Tax=Hymenobacter fodinae TaxID=2510796 RepID=A0A4Z0NYZ7_9BACT|nr:hypothetical protein [Hymenobacter fodinae]TGE03771.1 hypothetical protein EU556_24480 [Hymenobacter fodinae]